MNKYLMMSAAAMVATVAANVTPAVAGSATVTANNGTTSYCDVFTITWSGSNYADSHDWTPCGLSSVNNGMGIKGKSKGIGKNVGLSDYYKGDVSQGFDVTFQFQLPLKSGNAFNAYYTTNGTTVTQYIAGGYNVDAPGAKHPNTGVSTRDALPKRVQK